MSWAARFRARQYLKGSMWFVPLVSALLGPLLAALTLTVDSSDLPTAWQYSATTATSVLAAIVAAMVALTGFVVTVGVLIVQMATGTLSPRFMRLWYRDPLQKAVLGLLVGTLTFSFALLRNVEANAVPSLGVTLAGLGVTAGVVLFLLYLDRFLHRLRPVEVAALVGRLGARVLTESDALRTCSDTAAAAALRGPVTAVPGVRAGSIQAIDLRGLLADARRADCVLAVRYEVGDFVPRGATLIDVIGASSPPDDRRLLSRVAFGRERTIEQDPAFALRIMVDIALMALSPAVNAPTTAVQVIDHIEGLAQCIGERAVEDRGALFDEDERVRVLIPLRAWADYLGLAVVEIREYGITAPQVTRRLRAMLESLLGSVRPEHRPAVASQLEELDRALERRVPDVAQRAFARGSDRQGIGGRTAT